MKAVKNDLCNAVLKAEGCKNLPVRRVEYRGLAGTPGAHPVVKWTTWWEVSDEELIEIERAQRRGKAIVRLDVFGDGHPPVLMRVEPTPLDEWPDDEVAAGPPDASSKDEHDEHPGMVKPPTEGWPRA